MTARVVFASGKGGVGKSTVAVNVAAALARDGVRVGLVDADVYGPDIPAMVGLTRRTPARSVTLWQRDLPPLEPVERFGIPLVSAQFLVSEEQALDWSAPLVALLLRRLVTDVAWGTEPDLLLIDVPPGTGDLQQDLLELVPDAQVVLVVTPQHAAHLDCRKMVSMLRRRKTALLGGVENMSGFACPSCGKQTPLFAPAAAEHTIWAQDVERLGAIPFHPATATDQAPAPIVVTDPDAVASRELTAVARQIAARVG
jgi:ATP-binding protein involved in chromosome partitioning